MGEKRKTVGKTTNVITNANMGPGETIFTNGELKKRKIVFFDGKGRHEEERYFLG